MIEMALSKFIDETRRVTAAAHRATLSALRKTAYAIFRDVQASIVTDSKPSLPGEPPHSRRGLARRAERYDVDAAAETAVIGPRFSVIGTAMQPEEFGGKYRGDKYPQRPSIGPALQRNLDLLPAGFAGAATDE